MSQNRLCVQRDVLCVAVDELRFQRVSDFQPFFESSFNQRIEDGIFPRSNFYIALFVVVVIPIVELVGCLRSVRVTFWKQLVAEENYLLKIH